jgi:hypothetical protein
MLHCDGPKDKWFDCHKCAIIDMVVMALQRRTTTNHSYCWLGAVEGCLIWNQIR